MANGYQRWTDAQKQFVLDNWQKMTQSAIGDIIGRTGPQVASFLTTQGLRKTPKRKSPAKRPELIPVQIIKNHQTIMQPVPHKKPSARQRNYIKAEIPEELINSVNAKKARNGTYNDRRAI